MGTNGVAGYPTLRRPTSSVLLERMEREGEDSHDDDDEVSLEHQAREGSQFSRLEDENPAFARISPPHDRKRKKNRRTARSESPYDHIP